ncbi:CopG family transcriptional regulator (plasmid) [Nocardia sp. CA-084685]|uniref:ribbon-helix-helix domain-containing protein n=1 Tax=Nocardia sp. CA-084685 TaxID=3239970 RepID=UPI003D95B5BD
MPTPRVQTVAHLPADIDEALTEYSHRSGTTRSDIITAALRQYLTDKTRTTDTPRT